MIKDDLAARLAALKNGEAALIKQMEDLKNSLITQRGAMSECEF